MTRHAIVELEEGALNIVVGGRDGQRVVVTRSLRLPAPDLGRDALAAVLRAVPADVLEGTDGVHVVLGERRFQHFVSTVPVMPAADVVAFVTREALRLTGQQAAADLMVATRCLRVLPAERLLVGSTALARSVWEPFARAFAAVGWTVRGLHAMESCLALAAQRRTGPSAVLECNAGRARFVLIDGGCPLQVRRFLVGGAGEGNAGAMLAQLAVELPRTLDWLRESGQPTPRALLVGARVPVATEDLAQLRNEELAEVVRCEPRVDVAAGLAEPGLGVVELLARLAGGGDVPPSLLDPASLVVPLGRRRRLGVAAAVVAGLAFTAAGVTTGNDWWALRGELVAERRTGAALAEQFARLSAPTAGVADASRPRLDTALAARRPVSRLLAQVSNAAEPGLFVERLDFAATEPIVVAGFVNGATRQQALAQLAQFGKRLRDLPYLQAIGPDEVGEVAGQRNRYRFTFRFAWRNQ